MKELISLEKAIDDLYNKGEITYSNFISSPDHKNQASIFFTYIKTQLDKYLETANRIDPALLIDALKEFGDFKGNISKRRFINLIQKISDDFLKVLRDCYNPNPAHALIDLERLLGMNNRKLTPYVVEQLINYCTFDFLQNSVFYRARDAEEDEVVENCWHTPYYIRQKVYSGRFSSPGFPCLYLADSPETCYAEVGKLKQNYDRWLGEFKLKKNKKLVCLDLRIPNENTIKSSSTYQKICLLLTYPMRLLCTTYAEHKSDAFGEEYLFSQSLVNVLSHPLYENSGLCRVRGILYDSTKRSGGLNIALPAKSIQTPPSPNETFSGSLQDLFRHEKIFKVSLVNNPD